MKSRVPFLAFFGILAIFPLDALASELLDIAETATPEEIRQAIRNGADLNAVDLVGRTVLMHAAAWNLDPEVITLLVKQGAKVNARGPNGWTALMMAAYNNPNPQVIIALLKAGADPRLRNQAGNTAFVYAQDNDKLKGTEALRMLRTAAK